MEQPLLARSGWVGILLAVSLTPSSGRCATQQAAVASLSRSHVAAEVTTTPEQATHLVFSTSPMSFPQAAHAFAPGPQHDEEPSLGRPIVGALLGSLVGIGVGGAVLYASDCEAECLRAALTAGVLTSTGLVIGAHLGNRRRGNIWIDMLVSVGAAAAGIGLAEAIAPRGFGDGPGVAVGVFAFQFTATVAAERITGRRRHP